MKYIIGLIVGIIVLFLVIAMYCALIVAGRSDEQSNMENNEGDDIELFFKRQICPRCKTGKYTYELDRHSEACPYIGCWKKGKCSFFEPLESTPKKGILSGFKNKRSVTPPPKHSSTMGFLGIFRGE